MRGILFDLDGTLLDIDLEVFLARYFRALEAAIGHHAPAAFSQALQDATQRMMLPHDGRTNETVFWDRFAELTGVPEATWRPDVDRFYAEDFARLGDGMGPKPHARRVLETALDLGLRVAIATNPIFPLPAVTTRLAWAGIADLPVHLITTYETMRACKPSPAYFIQTAEMLGVDAKDCMMVGDDRTLDLAAADVGMKTYYVGTHDAVADFTGDLGALVELLPRLASA